MLKPREQQSWAPVARQEESTAAFRQFPPHSEPNLTHLRHYCTSRTLVFWADIVVLQLELLRAQSLEVPLDRRDLLVELLALEERFHLRSAGRSMRRSFYRTLERAVRLLLVLSRLREDSLRSFNAKPGRRDAQSPVEGEGRGKRGPSFSFASRISTTSRSGHPPSTSSTILRSQPQTVVAPAWRAWSAWPRGSVVHVPR